MGWFAEWKTKHASQKSKSHARSNFESCSHNIKANTVPPWIHSSLIWACIIIRLLAQNFVLTFVWSQITILNNSAIQNWKQNSEWIGYFRQQQQHQTETEMMSFSQLLSTSQINCHKGSEVALALVTTGVCGRGGCGTMVSERVFVSHCPGHLLLNLWWAFNFGEQQRD